MLIDYFALGKHEIINSARSIGYAHSKERPAFWLQDNEPCPSLGQVLGHTPYTHAYVESAPWFDHDNPELWRRFLGVVAVEARGLSDSTADSDSIELLGPGARTTGFRDASRIIQFRVVLTAEGEDALEAGLGWLRAVLRPGVEATSIMEREHATLSFFASCPPERTADDDDEEYAAKVHALRRQYHDVVLAEPPIVTRTMHSVDGRHVGALVEFALRAENPYLYGAPRELTLNPSIPYLTQDVPYNLVRFPRAELAEGTVEVGRNYLLNPSVEINATDWNGSASSVTGATITHGRSTELAASGTASFRSRLLGASGSPAANKVEARIYIQTPMIYFTNPGVSHYYPPPEGASVLPHNSRISPAVWAAVVVAAGAAGSEVLDLTAKMIWLRRSSEGAGALETDIPHLGPTTGRNFRDTQIAPPAVAADEYIATARIEVIARVRFSSSATAANNSDIRVYADAAAITIP